MLADDVWPLSVFLAVSVPREAYKLDFVFHSGEVYENNAGQDFFVAVEGGLDAASFTAWVAQQKREEQRRRLKEKEAAEQAEMERRRAEEALAQEAEDRESAAAGEGHHQERGPATQALTEGCSF